MCVALVTYSFMVVCRNSYQATLGLRKTNVYLVSVARLFYVRNGDQIFQLTNAPRADTRPSIRPALLTWWQLLCAHTSFPFTNLIRCVTRSAEWSTSAPISPHTNLRLYAGAEACPEDRMHADSRACTLAWKAKSNRGQAQGGDGLAREWTDSLVVLSVAVSQDKWWSNQSSRNTIQ